MLLWGEVVSDPPCRSSAPQNVQHPATHCQTSDIKRKKEALCIMSSNRNLTCGLVLSDRSLTSIGASKNTFKEEEEAVHLHPNHATSSRFHGVTSVGPEGSCKEEAEHVDMCDCHGPSSSSPLPHRGPFNLAPCRMPARQRTCEELPPPPPPSAPAMGYGL
jgi:hypothetical protein